MGIVGIDEVRHRQAYHRIAQELQAFVGDRALVLGTVGTVGQSVGQQPGVTKVTPQPPPKLVVAVRVDQASSPTRLWT